METKKGTLFCLIFTILFGHITYGFDSIGYPASELKAMQGSVNFNYSWGLLDIEAEGIPELGLTTDIIKNVEIQKKCSDLSIGLAEGFDFFARIEFSMRKLGDSARILLIMR